MPVRVYRSSDVGAPALRGNSPGDFINLLKKCLVDGYGSKPGAGWTQAFVNTEGTIAAFKQGLGSNGMYLRVDDTQLLASQGYRNARVVGYETMSDINTGLPGPFPRNDDIAGGLYWTTMYNSSGSWTARDQARQWTLIADEAFFVIQLKTDPSQDVTGANGYYREVYYFGDYISYKPGDSTNTIIRGLTFNSQSNSSSAIPYSSAASTVGSASGGLYTARNMAGTIVGANYGDHIDYAKSSSSSWGGGTSALSYPNGANGAAYMCPIWIHQPASSNQAILRGQMPGFWNFCHRVTGVDTGDTFDGQGDLAGRKLMIMKLSDQVISIDITDTWR